MSETENSRIREIKDQQLSGVAFVHDYVEFHFDGKVIRALSGPVANLDEVSVRFPDAGSRDALCRMIGAVVKSVHLSESIDLRIVFNNGGSIVISLEKGPDTFPESIHYVPGDGVAMEVW